MGGRFDSLFDDADGGSDLLTDDFDGEPPSHPRPKWGWGGLAAVGVLAACLSAAGWLVSGASSLVELSGPKVGQLQAGAAVVLGDMQVGVVDDVRLEDGRPVAMLKFDAGAADQIPADSQFKVGPIGELWPGNIGVLVESPDTGGFFSRDASADSELGGRSLSEVREVLADDSILPTGIPMKLVMVVVAGVFLVAFAFTSAGKVLGSRVWRYGTIAVAVLLIGYLFKTGHLQIEDVRGWIDWAVNLVRGGGGAPETISANGAPGNLFGRA